MHDGERFDLHLDAPGGRLDVAAVRFVQHDRELFAAVARRDVERPARAAAEAPRDLAQAFIAGLVPVVVVVSLEVVDIDQQHAERRIVTRRLRPDAIDVLVEQPAVVNARQAVTARGLDQQALSR
jgi:hypothetical protein